VYLATVITPIENTLDQQKRNGASRPVYLATVITPIGNTLDQQKRNGASRPVDLKTFQKARLPPRFVFTFASHFK
jgi:hypothetical protein